MKRVLPILLLVIVFACTKNKQNTIILDTVNQYRAVIQLPAGELPFSLKIKIVNEDTIAEFQNAEEILVVKNLTFFGDSLIIPGYVFESEFRVKLTSDSLVGNYVRLNTKKPYSIPFYAVKGQNHRFWENPNSKVDFSGKYAVRFEEDSSDAIAVLKQEGTKLTGTFLTPTGDYRFLEGQVSGDEFRLSTFDGAHAFLFTGNYDGQFINGMFYSGKHWEDKWSGLKNDSFELPKADTLTHFKEGFNKINYTYIDEKDDTIQVSHEDLLGKVFVIQILGTWCPNCMDETNFLVGVKEKFPDLNIVGLAFERPYDNSQAYKRINKLMGLLDVNYPMYHAGIADKTAASDAFPMLNKIISFPTTIVIDKKGEVQLIHTGFSGPGTGQVYDDFSNEFYKLVDRLYKE